MKECGLMIRLTVLENINMLTELCTKENGKKIFSMEKELRPGLMNLLIKETMHLDASMESVLINGMINLNILETGAKIRSVELVFTLGLMVVVMRVNGLKITWKVWESTFGKMAVNTKVNIRMTKSMDLVSTFGLMVDVTKDIGTEENNMDLENMLYQKMIKLNMVYGKMENVLNGLVMSKFMKLTMDLRALCNSSIPKNLALCVLNMPFSKCLTISMNLLKMLRIKSKKFKN